MPDEVIEEHFADPIPGHFPIPDQDDCGGCGKEWPCRGWLLGQLLLAQTKIESLEVALSRVALDRRGVDAAAKAVWEYFDRVQTLSVGQVLRIWDEASNKWPHAAEAAINAYLTTVGEG